MNKFEILDYIFKSKDGASWNEVSEMLNEYEHDKVQLFMNWLYEIWYRKRYMTPLMLVDLYFEETQSKFKSEPLPSDEFKYCNHHHKLTQGYVKVDFGDGEFIANKMAIPILKALNELGLRTRTHHTDENGGFVSILIENGIRAEIKEVNELDANRTKYNGKTELLISWDSKLPDTAKAGGQK